MIKPWGLYLISDEPMLADGSFLRLLEHALGHGLRIVQMRAKSLPIDTLLSVGAQIRRMTSDHHAAFIVNDDPDLALRLQADGVHIGQSDASPEVARHLLGPDRLIGFSAHSRRDILRAHLKPVDYVSLGPIFATRTKTDAEQPVGVELLKWANRTCTLPLVAIGGITLDNLDDVLQAETRNVAVISAISRSADPPAAAREFIRRISPRLSAQPA